MLRHWAGVLGTLAVLTSISCLLCTTWRPSGSLTPCTSCWRETPALNEPQGEFSRDPPYSSVAAAAASARRLPESVPSSSDYGRSSAETLFILTRSFGGQLTRAVKNLMMQQCWARDLSREAVILEPFSQDSQLLHSREIWRAFWKEKNGNVARFSDYFDLSLFNTASRADGGAPLIPWEEFWFRAPRNALVVATPSASCALIVNHHLQTKADKDLKEFLLMLQYMNFKVTRIVPVNCYDRGRSQKMRQLVLDHSHNSTIVFSTWRNYNVARSWLEVSRRCNISDKYPASRLRPSAMMVRHTNNYRTGILRADKTIAVMLRVERFLTFKSAHHISETVDSCLAKTLAVYSDLKKAARWAASQPFLTLDIGRYGSGEMQSNESVVKMAGSLEAVTESVTRFLVEVYGGRWRSLEEWEDSFLQATEGFGERGYVAMLQREIAVSSDCLVLMGGGSFQEVAATHYLHAHPDPAHQCLHLVCTPSSLAHSLERTTAWRPTTIAH